ncbi:MAG: hypothetical protein AAF585_14750 [Verrucomicrobiota bacterium]
MRQLDEPVVAVPFDEIADRGDHFVEPGVGDFVESVEDDEEEAVFEDAFDKGARLSRNPQVSNSSEREATKSRVSASLRNCRSSRRTGSCGCWKRS